MTLTRQELESKLWQAADILRGQIDAADYKNYIFSILFLKRLSDRFDEEIEDAVAEGVPRELALRDRDEHEFFVPESARWPAIIGSSMNLGEALNIAGHAVENANTPRLDGVLAGTNWNDESKLGSPANRERIIRRLFNHFGDLDLRDDNLQEDAAGGGNVLGDAYEYLINKFADDAGKKGGEFYTPRPVVRLIVELLQPREGMRICDPTAGSGGMLIYASQYVQEQGRHPQPRAPRPRAQPGDAGHRQAQPAPPRPAGRAVGGRRRHRRAAADRPVGTAALLRPGNRESSVQPEELGARLRAERSASPVRPLRRYPAEDEGRPRLPAAHAGGHQRPRHGGRGDAPWRPLPGRRGGDDTQGHRRGRPVRGGHRPGAQPLLRRQHSGGHLRAEQAKPAERRGKVLLVDAAQEDCFRQGKAQNFIDPEHIARIAGRIRRSRT